MILLWAALSMALKDCLATWLVIAEARGRAVLAGVLDAVGDLAAIFCTVFGAGQVITHGLDLRTFEVLGVMVVTSFFGTIAWTTLGRRIEASPDSRRA